MLAAVPLTAGRVFVVANGRGRVAATISLAGSTARPRVLALKGIGAALAVGGASVMRRQAQLSQWPWCGDAKIESAVGDVIRGFELYGLVVPRQPDRHRLVALGRARGIGVVAKLSAEAGSVTREAWVLEQLSRRPLPSIGTPRPLRLGAALIDHTRVHILATEYVAGSQRPAWSAPPLRCFGRELAARLGELSKPDGCPDHWLPSHLDVSPWNLRRTGRGIHLFDWETCDYAPPETDRAYFGACVAAMGRGPVPGFPDECRAYLRDMVAARVTPGASMDERLLAMLESMNR